MAHTLVLVTLKMPIGLSLGLGAATQNGERVSQAKRQRCVRVCTLGAVRGSCPPSQLLVTGADSRACLTWSTLTIMQPHRMRLHGQEFGQEVSVPHLERRIMVSVPSRSLERSSE